jgi:hypothetical protein
MGGVGFARGRVNQANQSSVRLSLSLKHSVYLSNDCIGMTLASIPLTRRTQVYPI